VNIPDFTYDRGAAVCRWSDPATEFSFDRVLTDRRSGEVTAELAVWITAPTRALLHRGRLNLLSTTSRATFAKHLAGRHAGPDWAGLLEVGSFRVVDASRKGRARRNDRRRVRISSGPNFRFRSTIQSSSMATAGT